MEKREMKIAFFATMFISAGLLAGSAIASQDPWRQTQTASYEMSRETSALRSLVLALVTGKDAMRPLRGPPSDNHAEKDRLNAPITGLECYIDRIASYVSCYSSLMDPEEAATLVTSLIVELQAALPPDRWKESAKQPGKSPMQSYSYEDRESNARITIDTIDRLGLGGQSSYMVSLFGWTR
jgi:hypothetical protein